ncbi:MAG: DUF4401 domain-containing protein [Gammaproteobacteria bacterium]|nr:DUF4401 domain-containing protein [Gammaproteobacteria bacterium]
MSRQAEQLWSLLKDANLVKGEIPETPTIDSPWYVKVILAFSGWLAAVFLLGFIAVGLTVIIENSGASIIVGGLMVAAAYKLLQQPKNEFFEHLALAASLAGQCLFIWGVFESVRNHQTIWFTVAVIQLPLAIFMPNYVHRVFSAFFAAFSFSMGLAEIGIPYIFSGLMLMLVSWVWLNEFKYSQHIKKLQAIGYGLVLALIQIKGSALFSHGGIGWYSSRQQSEFSIQPWMGEVLAGVALVYVVLRLLQRQKHHLSDRLSIIIIVASIIASIVLSLVSMEANGITVGLVIIILGFAASNRILLGLGVASLLFYISSYYYLLDYTLLEKSQTLFFIGLALLIIRWILLRITKNSEETDNG